MVDTSVWVDYFNGNDTRQTEMLDNSLIEGLVVIGDVIFLEILQGFRNDNDYKNIGM